MREKPSYSLSFVATKHGVELTESHDDDSGALYDALGEWLEGIAEELIPKCAATGWFYVDLVEKTFEYEIHTVHA